MADEQNDSTTDISRRDFVTLSVAAAAGLAVGTGTSPRPPSPSSRTNVDDQDAPTARATPRSSIRRRARIRRC